MMNVFIPLKFRAVRLLIEFVIRVVLREYVRLGAIILFATWLLRMRPGMKLTDVWNKPNNTESKNIIVTIDM